MTVSNGSEEIDYKALFEQVQKENEGIRIRYFKLKNDEQSFIERIKEKFAELADSEHLPMFVYASIMIFVAVIVPLIRTLFQFIFRRETNEG